MDKLKMILDVFFILGGVWMILLANNILEINRFWTWMKLGSLAAGIGIAVAAWLNLVTLVYKAL